MPDAGVVNSPLRPYLVKSFETLFIRYSPEWITLALDMVEEHRELMAGDFTVKFPDAGTRLNFDEALADKIETDTTILAPLLYRIAHGIFRRDPQHAALPYFAQVMKLRTGMEIYYSTVIGPRFLVMHGIGTVVGPRSVIGSDFMIYQGVTLGQRRVLQPKERMVIGDHCTVFAGAKLIGNLRIGDHVNVGANAVLLTDAESNSTYAGIPAVKVR